MLCWESMRRDRKQISLLARILIDKYGQDAPTVAAHRVRLWTEADDPAIAALWRGVGEAIARRQREPSLREVLDGVVTRLTMDADRVSRKDVEAMMSGAAKKRRRSRRRSRNSRRRSTRRA